MAKKTEVKMIEVPEICPKVATVTIVGDSDLILNKMNDVVARKLIDERKDKAKSLEKPNKWEEIITAIHWRDGKPDEFTEESLKKALIENAPCIPSFGFKKQLNKTVVRNKIDTYSTAFDANVNIFGYNGGGLIPITFTEHFIDELLMQPKRGTPILQRINRFSGWKATFDIAYMENVFSLSSILNIINLCGFGIGIQSGTSSGFGRFHVENIK